MVFHLLVILKVIPYSIVWGGSLRSESAMYKYEAVALLVNALFLLVVLLESKIVTWKVRDSLLHHALWTMFGLFLINAFANLLSDNSLEKMIFTPVTILLAGFTIILLMKRR
jgi:hypothetical protein